MGFNLIRFITDAQYRCVRRWYRDGGDQSLRYNYNLGPSDIVFDIGAYKGHFAEEVARRFGSKVEAFEPVGIYADAARARTAQFPSVQVHSFGLAKNAGQSSISIEGLASSRAAASRKTVVAEFRNIVEVCELLGSGGIALMKINIEGDEYEILPALMDAGFMTKIRDIQVQFHLFKSGDKARYRAIKERLERTHKLTWRYPFIWENWRLKANV